jgi:hypothetical protein
MLRAVLIFIVLAFATFLLSVTDLVGYSMEVGRIALIALVVFAFIGVGFGIFGSSSGKSST